MSVTLRPMRHGDLPLLLGWLREPHVVAWWRDEPQDLAAVEAKYAPCIGREDPTELFVIGFESRPVGMIQRYLFADEPEWAAVLRDIADVGNAAGIDYLIGDPKLIGRGIGTATVTEMTAMVWHWRPVDSVVVTVQQANTASWRILEKAGYQRVWEGELESPDSSDEGPEYAYVISRP